MLVIKHEIALYLLVSHVIVIFFRNVNTEMKNNYYT